MGWFLGLLELLGLLGALAGAQRLQQDGLYPGCSAVRWPLRLRGPPTLPAEINWSQHITFLSTFLPSHCPVSCSESVMTPSTEVR